MSVPIEPTSTGGGETPGIRRAPLSAREVEVVKCWILTDTKQEVARQLFVSVGTVNTHVTRVREKYRAVERPASTKATLLARFLQDGHIDIADL